MALLNLFVLLVDSLIELYFCIELTLFFFFSFGCFNVLFSTSMDIQDSVCVSSISSNFFC